MAEAAHTFADSVAYERFMGRWSRAVAPSFLEWISAAPGATWLDVGCGTGIFTELILERCAPAAVFGIDPQRAQIDHAKRQPFAQRATLRVAHAEALPFSDAAFDVVASALAINFISDRTRALSEMRRVARPGGTVAGFVWDFEAERSPSWPLRATMRKTKAEVPDIPGAHASSLRALTALFDVAGLQDVATTTIDVTLSYADFEAFWDAQTPSYSPTTRIIDVMSARQREQLKRRVRAALPTGPSGAIEYAARANAVKGRA
ncbi:MAG: class I SAM-dependent methyltransferase [Burkholderiaceae bacterium]